MPNSFHRTQWMLYANEFHAIASNSSSMTSNKAGSTNGINTTAITRRYNGRSPKLRFVDAMRNRYQLDHCP